MAVTFVVSYDISEDKVRSRVSALLQAYGDRIQKSVFLLTVDAEAARTVIERATAMVDVDRDSIYVLQQCRTCWEALVCIGQANPPSRELYLAAL
jgi:CRISPR-associated protein Cas2